MTSRTAPSRALQSACRQQSTCFRCQWSVRRKASTLTNETDASEDVIPDSSLLAPQPDQEIVTSWDPVQRSRARRRQLPSSRYKYRPPRYYRGPFHPHQPPPASSPNSRLFIPGPFSLPRLQQTYTSTLAPDLLSLLYTHHPPGTLPGPAGQRLRSWDDSSPYHKNRPLRGPRGRPNLPLMKRPITFRNIPRLEKIVVHHVIRSPEHRDSSYLHVSGMILQAITNVRATVCRAKHDITSFRMRKNWTPMAVKVELRGEDMYCFLSKVVEVVMPKIKEYKGVSGGSGDGSGNLAFGLQASAVGLFPEVEVNYDMYPPKMIPGIDVMVCTTATNDRDARVLLSSMGIPFYGKHVN
ncbi:MAG: hypothetical protein L6R40_003363 [Gallowayella cf. fulva]|nr:MAG: hypothetical protein L6R40_003363 [Xanthomendoza cf. fulva]